jgi:KUP system potassium uptake protein
MQPSSQSNGGTRVSALALGAIGVVYGDIGTSPLYTMKEVFAGAHPLPPTEANVLGILSLVFWALIVVVSLKYVVLIMRADNNGEGGIMALIALVQRGISAHPRVRWLLSAAGIFGAALFYGDGMITPAISVLSAVEGLKVAAPVLEPLVIPVSLGILIALFFIQRRGTGSVGILFGPVMALWFATLVVLGIHNILQHPDVLTAVNPAHAVDFFRSYGIYGFLALGAVVLAVTGAEALYADMGHFGKKAVRATWFGFVLPALLINYFGQGALLLEKPTALTNPFFNQAPGWSVLPLVALATAATIIASQAVISGAYSVTRQAIQLGYLPRMNIIHTSEVEKGQIYIPLINWLLLAGVILLVLGFQSSGHLAAAYGIAVTGTMAIDTILACFVAYALWRMNILVILLVLVGFLTVDLAFFGANFLKLFQGGWFPLVIGAGVFTLLSTWKRGRELLMQRLQTAGITLEPFIQSLIADPPVRVPGTAVFLTASREGVPHALMHNLAHNKVLHERVVLLTVLTEDVPWVPVGERVQVEDLGGSFYRVVVRYGFKNAPNIPKALELCQVCGQKFNLMETSFFLSRETLVPTKMPGMALWREKLFAWMARTAGSAMSFFRIPTNRVVELGTQIEL